MWWSKAFVAILVLGLAGCGFRPMYGSLESSAGIGPELAQIRVLAIEDRQGQQLRNALVHLITPGGEPMDTRYHLNVQTSSSVSGLGFQKNAEATLGRLDMVATFTLKNLEGGTLFTGQSRSVVSFNFLGPRYGSIAHERDAEDRATQDIAQDIRRQLGTFFARNRTPPQ